MLENLLEALVILIVGIGGVFISLIFFYLLIFLLKTVDEKINKIRVSKKLGLKSTEKQEKDILTPELVAVISASAFIAIQKPIIVKRIHFLDDHGDTPWARIGRLNIIGSHNIRR